MEPEDTGNETKRERAHSTRRACDQCRLRKIRCDKRLPCSNCRLSKIACRSTGAGQKPPEQRRRVLISSQYEQKVDLIEDRLANIEDALRDLKSTIITTTSTSTSKKPPSTALSTIPNEPVYHPTPPSKQITPASSGYTAAYQHEASPPFEGNSSLAAHSAYASEFLETAVSQSALQMSSPKIGAALSTLKQIVSLQDHQAHPSSSREVRLPNQKTIRGAGLQDLAMPPMDMVLSLCRWIKADEADNPPTLFQGYFPFISVDKFIEKCKEVYFAIEDYSDATFIVVNGGLYNIFIEWSFAAKDHESREEGQKYLSLCRNNLETALANLNLLMPARAESIEALALGAIHAIEISKPSFAWTLTSTAARLCQTLGYHRASSMDHDSPSVQQAKTGLFWSIYCLDKALSLRLGRSSSIQDYDISLPPVLDTTGVAEPWKTLYPLWMRLARIQGKVYELLYSPAALAQPEEDRVSHALQLASEMKVTVMDPFNTITDDFPLSEIQVFYIESDRVSRYAVLTLIYRAIPSAPGSMSAFIPECIEAARAALETHQVCMNTTLRESNEVLKCSYMHWTILYAPFIPFIVLICHILEVPVANAFTSTANPNPNTTNTNTNPSNANANTTPNQSDLTRLTDFVLSLRPLTAHSEAVANLHRLCNVLCSVARLYVEAKAKAKQQQQQTGSGASVTGAGAGGAAGGAASGTSEMDEGVEGREEGWGSGAREGEMLASVGLEFDTYLSALGLAPPPPSSSSGYHAGTSNTGMGGVGWAPTTTTGPTAPASAAATSTATTATANPANTHATTTVPEADPEDTDVPMTSSSSTNPNPNPTTNTNPSNATISPTTQLGNWFSGNQYMMGLLEEDLSLIDFMAWS